MCGKTVRMLIKPSQYLISELYDVSHTAQWETSADSGRRISG